MRPLSEEQIKNKRASTKAWKEKNKGRVAAYNSRADRKHIRLAATNKWKRDNPEKHKAALRRANFKRKYGVTEAQRDAILATQNYKCAICHSSDPKNKNGWHTDHCHATNRVRGLLCAKCNVMLGFVKDNVATLRAAADYLERYL